MICHGGSGIVASPLTRDEVADDMTVDSRVGSLGAALGNRVRLPPRGPSPT
jgi:hypothetical protein